VTLSKPSPKRGMQLPGYSELLRKPLPRPVVRGIRDTVRTYAVLSAGSRQLPDYLVIGTKKGGTTSLINWLVNHPSVSRMYPSAQKLKSAHYFDLNYARGDRWYRSHFPSNRARLALERRTGAITKVGEASPYYMFHPAVPDRVAATFAEVKLIALLRDPVSRAYSNFWDRRATGTEDLTTFEAALNAEEERLASVDYDRLANDPTYYSFHHDNHSYLARGRYLEHLQAWIDTFERDQLLILPAESMFTDPERVFELVQKFIGLPLIGNLSLPKFNERPREPMSPAIRQRLTDYFRPHNAALYAALGQDFGWEPSTPPAH
jgi:Sulfotransferase domain